MATEPGDQIKIPQQIEDIHPQWLQSALQLRFPQVRVADVSHLRIIQGTGTKVQVELRYDCPSDLPTTMWVKTAFATDHLEKALAIKLYALEALFYGEFAPRVGLGVPECYFAHADLASGRGVVLLEDLVASESTFPDYGTPLTVDQVASGLAQLADLHGRSWRQPWLRHPALNPLMAPGSLRERHYASYSYQYIADFVDGPAGAGIPDEIRDADRIFRIPRIVQPALMSDLSFMLHGDAHAGNCYFRRDGSVGLLDWQVPALGPWFHDVAYWMAGALSVDDRRKHERDLLSDYLLRLRLHGVSGIEDDQAWQNYRHILLYGLWVWLRNPSTMQPLKNNIALTERFGAAVYDHESFKLSHV